LLTLFSVKQTERTYKHLAVTAPSGAGKTTIVRHLLSKYDYLDFSTSATNRERREKETEGEDYYFLTTKEFQRKIEEGHFVEWEEVYEGQYYGTLFSEIKSIEELKKSIVFDIDVKGAVSIKESYGSEVLTLFIKPPSYEILKKRLEDRGTESAASLAKRLERVQRELTYENKFDLVLVNDDLDIAFEEAEIIVEKYIKP